MTFLFGENLRSDNWGNKFIPNKKGISIKSKFAQYLENIDIHIMEYFATLVKKFTPFGLKNLLDEKDI